MDARVFASDNISWPFSTRAITGGLDVTDRFFKEGLSLIKPALLQSKAPHTHVIDKSVLRRVTQLKPDFVVCVSVLMNVPSQKLDQFLDTILNLLAFQTRLLVFFNEAASTIRTASKPWAYDSTTLLTFIRGRQPHVRTICQTGPIKYRVEKQDIYRSILIVESMQRPEPVTPESTLRTATHQ